MFVQETHASPRSQAALFALFLLVILGILAPGLFGQVRPGEGLLLLLLALVTGGLGVVIAYLSSTVRVTIDDQVLTVGFGPFRETVPLARIATCGATTYRWWDWGGWGIRLGWRARLYNVPGDRGIAVQLVMEDGQRLLFSSSDPEAVCRTLRERRPEIQSA